MNTEHVETTPALGPLERTAPRAVADCPQPRVDAWREERPYVEARTLSFASPLELVDEAGRLQRRAEGLVECAALALAAEGRSVREVAEATGLTQKAVRELVARDELSRGRLAYSTAYYQRHPDRTPGDWYPVEDGDPELPAESSFSVRTRPLKVWSE